MNVFTCFVFSCALVKERKNCVSRESLEINRVITLDAGHVVFRDSASILTHHTAHRFIRARGGLWITLGAGKLDAGNWRN